MLEVQSVGNRFEVILDKKRIGTIYMEIDGYYVFSPVARYRGGYWSEDILLGIGNILKKMNKKWDDSINEFFRQEQDKPESEQFDDF